MTSKSSRSHQARMIRHAVTVLFLGCFAILVIGNLAACGGGSTTPAYRAAIGALIAEDPVTHLIYPCTATVVQSASKSLIITAGHCVEGFNGQRFTHFSFAPLHDGPTCLQLVTCGNNPKGVWTASASDVTIDARFPAQQRLDVAFITLPPNSQHQRVEDMVGGVALEFNGPTNGSWTAYGYPHGSAVPATPGAYETSFVTCSGAASPHAGDVPGTGPPPLEMPCDQKMTAGASGGPWIDASSGKLGAVNKASNASALVGTYLGGEVQALLHSIPATTPAAASVSYTLVKDDGMQSTPPVTWEVTYMQISGLTDQAVQAAINTQLRDTLEHEKARFLAGLAGLSPPPSGSPPSDVTLGVQGSYITARLVSVGYGGYEMYSGAAHGLAFDQSLNFDLTSGKLLTNRDLVDPGAAGSGDQIRHFEALQAAVLALVQVKLAPDGAVCTIDPQKVIGGPGDPSPLFFTQMGAMIGYPNYTFGANPCGFTPALIPYAQLAGVLNPLYFPAG